MFTSCRVLGRVMHDFMNEQAVDLRKCEYLLMNNNVQYGSIDCNITCISMYDVDRCIEL